MIVCVVKVVSSGSSASPGAPFVHMVTCDVDGKDLKCIVKENINAHRIYK